MVFLENLIADIEVQRQNAHLRSLTYLLSGCTLMGHGVAKASSQAIIDYVSMQDAYVFLGYASMLLAAYVSGTFNDTAATNLHLAHLADQGNDLARDVLFSRCDEDYQESELTPFGAELFTKRLLKQKY